VRPSGYSFLPELAASPVKQISIETAQSNLDCSTLEKLPGKTIILGTLDLSDMRTYPPCPAPCTSRTHRGGTGLRPEIAAPRNRLRQRESESRPQTRAPAPVSVCHLHYNSP
jgi:hypothetical protein